MYDVCVAYLLADVRGTRCVLLGEKNRGVGDGKVVAPGGKLERGETPEAAAVREIREETGLKISRNALNLAAVIEYSFPTKPDWSQRSFAFCAHVDPATPVASSELQPWWCPVEAIPWGRMWQDAQRWVPAVLEGGTDIRHHYTFGSDLTTLRDEEDNRG